MTLKERKLTLTEEDITRIANSKTEQLKLWAILRIMCHTMTSRRPIKVISQHSDGTKTAILREGMRRDGSKKFTTRMNNDTESVPTKLTHPVITSALSDIMLYIGITPPDVRDMGDEIRMLEAFALMAWYTKLASHMIAFIENDMSNDYTRIYDEIKVPEFNSKNSIEELMWYVTSAGMHVKSVLYKTIINNRDKVSQIIPDFNFDNPDDIWEEFERVDWSIYGQHGYNSCDANSPDVCCKILSAIIGYMTNRFAIKPESYHVTLTNFPTYPQNEICCSFEDTILLKEVFDSVAINREKRTSV